MLEVLQYVTSGFWVFVGCAILLGIAASAFDGIATTLIAIIKAPRGR